jgi:hypothetical protein
MVKADQIEHLIRSQDGEIGGRDSCGNDPHSPTGLASRHRRSGGPAGPRLAGSFGWLLGARFRCRARRWVSSPGCLGGLDACLERSHHVDDLRLVRLDRGGLELLTGGRAADQVEDLDPVVVLILVRANSALGDLTSSFDRNFYQEVRAGSRAW